MGFGNIAGLRCLQCGTSYRMDQVGYSCPSCDLDGALDVEYDYSELGRSFREQVQCHAAFDMWRYHALLPVDAENAPQQHTGGTPLYRLRMPGCGRLLVKDDSRNPSGSLKDRASALAVALAAEVGAKTVAAASTGNAAAALACMAAGTELRCVIFAPSNAAQEKLAQIRAYGAEIVDVEGGYDEAFDACDRACHENGWYNRSTGLNSYMTEGKKTVAFEIFEQMHWAVPDRVFVPVGNGCIVGAVYKGFEEIKRMGLADRVPRIMGAQAEGSDYMWRAWRDGAGPHTAERRQCHTAASSISVALPRDRIKALRAVEASGGEFLRVSDSHIFAAQLALARATGVFAEPGAAAAYAAACQFGAGDRDETTVVLNTGSGLKDIGGLLRSGVLHVAAEVAEVPRGTLKSVASMLRDESRHLAG
ncbi:threonine synthase [Achromobacter sp.]|uniref:threonine synthase n=1 Tax=Achromobacter sp. TaxID=134375 RepID=UPI003C741E8A